LKLWEKIRSGRHDTTQEGVVIHPAEGVPAKIKKLEEHDTLIHSFVPGKGRLAGKGIGAIRYTFEPGQDVVGEVGTGISDRLRREMHEDPAAFIGRVARVRAQGAFPSGALRAPALLGLHEDYPSAKQADAVPRTVTRENIAALLNRTSEPTQAGVFSDYHRPSPALCHLHAWPGAPATRNKAADMATEGQSQTTSPGQALQPDEFPEPGDRLDERVLAACLQAPDAAEFHEPMTEPETMSPVDGLF
jgi:hypothetical protein